MSQLFVQMKPVKLSGSGISSTATSIGVQTFQDPGGNDVVTADLTSQTYATLEPGTSREEIISFTGVTHSSTDNSATLTGVTRNLDYTTPYTQISATGFAHAGGTLLVISNNPQIYDDFLSEDNDETITGLYTFTASQWPKMSDGTTAPTADAELATKKYVDDFASVTAVSKNAEIVAATAGETIAAGEAVYFDETANEWLLADGNVAAKCNNVRLGIAQGAGTDGAGITGGVLLSGRDENQSGLTAGNRIYLSDTAGAIAESAGTEEVEIGHAISATTIDFNPRYASVPTGDEKDAMAGTSGTPSSGNLFATELGNQRAVESYAVDSVGTDSYAVTLDPVPTAYVAGMTIRVLFGTANTGAATIDVNSLGVKNITKNGAVALDDNDIKANQVSVLVYDGTQFQLQAVASDLTVANAATLTDGSNADALHEHEALLGLNVANTTFSYSLPMEESKWTLTDCVIGAGTGAYTRIDSNAATWEFYGPLPNVNGDTDAALKWDQTKTVTVEWRAQAVGTTGDKHMGFNTATGFSEAYSGTSRKVCFASDGATLYAVTADNATNNNTDISAGITITNWNTYKIVWTPGTNALFYVNGALLATETANIPSGTTDSLFGFGGETDAEEWLIAGIHVIQTL